MKTIIVIISVVMISIVSLIFVACTTQNNNEIEVVVMRDVTDIHLSNPKTEDIIKFYNLDKSPWDGAIFRFIDITDVSYNQVYEVSLEPENLWMGNEMERGKKVKKFYERISSILNDMGKEKTGRESSSVYIPLAHELNRLNQSTSQKKILLIYSDLMENTSGMSFYSKQNLRLIKTNPKQIREYFDKQQALKSINSIYIELVYQPLNIESDELFKSVSGFYKSYFEDKGAKVEIKANIY